MLKLNILQKKHQKKASYFNRSSSQSLRFFWSRILKNVALGTRVIPSDPGTVATVASKKGSAAIVVNRYDDGSNYIWKLVVVIIRIAQHFWSNRYNIYRRDLSSLARQSCVLLSVHFGGKKARQKLADALNRRAPGTVENKSLRNKKENLQNLRLD